MGRTRSGDNVDNSLGYLACMPAVMKMYREPSQGRRRDPDLVLLHRASPEQAMILLLSSDIQVSLLHVEHLHARPSHLVGRRARTPFPTVRSNPGAYHADSERVDISLFLAYVLGLWIGQMQSIDHRTDIRPYPPGCVSTHAARFKIGTISETGK